MLFFRKLLGTYLGSAAGEQPWCCWHPAEPGQGEHSQGVAAAGPIQPAIIMHRCPVQGRSWKGSHQKWAQHLYSIAGSWDKMGFLGPWNGMRGTQGRQIRSWQQQVQIHKTDWQLGRMLLSGDLHQYSLTFLPSQRNRKFNSTDDCTLMFRIENQPYFIY